MSLDLGTLFVKVSVLGHGNIVAMERQLLRAQGATTGLTAAVTRLGPALIAALAVGKVVNLADEMTEVRNRVVLATDSLGDFKTVNKGVVEISRKTASEVGTTALLFQRLSSSTDSLGTSQEEVLRLTETINKAVALGGSNTQEAAGALLQFTQAMGNNFRSSAQELNSLNEQAPGLAKALAEGLGVPVESLKELAEQGELTKERVVAALMRISSQVDEDFSKVDFSISKSLKKVEIGIADFIGEVDSIGGVSTKFAEMAEDVSKALTDDKLAESFLVFVERQKLAFERLFQLVDETGDKITNRNLGKDLETVFFKLGDAGVFENMLHPLNAFVTLLGIAITEAEAFFKTIERGIQSIQSKNEIRGQMKAVQDSVGSMGYAEVAQRASALQLNMDGLNIEQAKALILEQEKNTLLEKWNSEQEHAHKREMKADAERLAALEALTNAHTGAAKVAQDRVNKDKEDRDKKILDKFSGSKGRKAGVLTDLPIEGIARRSELLDNFSSMDYKDFNSLMGKRFDEEISKEKIAALEGQQEQIADQQAMAEDALLHFADGFASTMQQGLESALMGDGADFEMLFKQFFIRQLTASLSSDLTAGLGGLISKGASGSSAFGGFIGAMGSLFGLGSPAGAPGALTSVDSTGFNALDPTLFKFAKGGDLHIGKPTLVGEEGPELITPRSGGYVNTAAQTAGQKVVQNFYITTPDAQSFQSARARIAGDMRRLVGN